MFSIGSTNEKGNDTSPQIQKSSGVSENDLQNTNKRPSTKAQRLKDSKVGPLCRKQQNTGQPIASDDKVGGLLNQEKTFTD